MKKLIWLVACVLLMGFIFSFSSTGFAEEDESKMVTELIKNDKVEVTEAIRPPGTIVPMHTHGPYVAYIFEACKVKFSFPDGKSVVKEIPAGKVIWSDGVTHEVEVLGDTSLHVLHIALK